MSCRARRVVNATLAQPFAWTLVAGDTALAHEPAAVAGADAAPSPPSAAEQQAHLAALERDAFAKGYAAGERAGVEAGAKRADAMLRRVAQTLEELGQLRKRMIRETERQMVQLALTLARRVVARQLALEPDLVAAMAHVALERLGEDAPATIRLHPEDYSTIAAIRGESWAGSQVRVMPDPAIARGGCVVESDFGLIDASLDAQLGELARALIGGEPGSIAALGGARAD